MTSIEIPMSCCLNEEEFSDFNSRETITKEERTKSFRL